MKVIPHPTTLIVETVGEHVVFLSDANIDADGSGPNKYNDPDFAPDTSLHYQGKALNSLTERYIVVPPIICEKTRGVVLGCQAWVRNTAIPNSKVITAVVGDVGPHGKTGEVSCALAEALGLDPNARHGGTSDKVIIYELAPSLAAEVDGKVYDLQPYV